MSAYAQDTTQVQVVRSTARPTRQARILFCRLVAVMVRAGISLPNAIRIAGEGSVDPAMQKTSGVIADLLLQGASLPEAIDSCPNMFEDLHVGLIDGGDAIGNFDVVFFHIAEAEAVVDGMHKRILAALIQPAIILAGLFLFAIFGPRIFIPQVRAMASDFGSEMPWFSNVIFGISEFIGSLWFWVGVVIVAGFLYYKWETLFRREQLQRLLYATCYRIPWLSVILRSILQAHWARIVSMQLSSGVTLLDALRRIQHGIEDPVFCQACKDISQSLKDGESITDAMQLTGYFDRLVLGMVAVGEENGKLPELLAYTAKFYEEELATRLETFENLLTPALLTLAGVIVGAWVIAVILPLSNLIGGMAS